MRMYVSLCAKGQPLMAYWCHSSAVFYLVKGAVFLIGLKPTQRLCWLNSVLQGASCLQLSRTGITSIHASQHLIMVCVCGGGRCEGFFILFYFVFLTWTLGIELRSLCLQSKYLLTKPSPYPPFLLPNETHSNSQQHKEIEQTGLCGSHTSTFKSSAPFSSVTLHMAFKPPCRLD